MPPLDDEPLEVSRSEAACLEAIRCGAQTKTQIALRAGFDLKQAQALLERLASAELIERGQRTWRLTPRGCAAASTRH